MPDSLRGRAADNWRGLFSIADAAGGEWPQRGSSSRGVVFGRGRKWRFGIMLLEEASPPPSLRGKWIGLSSKDLCDALAEREDRPWIEFKNGKPLTQRQLARLLEPFSIVPGKHPN